MYEKTYQSILAVEPENASNNWNGLFYLKAWDAFFLKSGLEYARVFRDGTKAKFGAPSGGVTPIGRVNGVPAWYSTWTQRIYPAFELLALPDPNTFLNPDYLITSTPVFVDDVYGIYLHQPNSNQVQVRSLDDGSLVGTVTHNAGELFSAVAWVQGGQACGLCPSSGKVKIFDYLGGLRVVEYGRIDPFLVAAYDCTCHTFFSIGTDHLARTYVRVGIPAALSAPEFTPADVYGVKANTVRVQLTGDDGEPCPDYWVHWALADVGDGLLGYLDKAVSKTATDGYAANIYYGPEDNLPGSCQVQASVLI